MKKFFTFILTLLIIGGIGFGIYSFIKTFDSTKFSQESTVASQNVDKSVVKWKKPWISNEILLFIHGFFVYKI